MKELWDTLEIISATRGKRAIRSELYGNLRRSFANDDPESKEDRKESIDEEDACQLSGKLSYSIDDLLGHLFRPVQKKGVVRDVHRCPLKKKRNIRRLS